MKLQPELGEETENLGKRSFCFRYQSTKAQTACNRAVLWHTQAGRLVGEQKSPSKDSRTPEGLQDKKSDISDHWGEDRLLHECC